MLLKYLKMFFSWSRFDDYIFYKQADRNLSDLSGSRSQIWAIQLLDTIVRV